MYRRCNSWTYNNNFTEPNPKFSWKTQKPQKIWKTSKPRSKMHECMKREKMRTLTKCLELDLGQRTCGWGDLRVKEFWVERESFLSREKWENENRIAPQLYIEKRILMDQGSVEVLLNCCRRQKHELDGLKHLSRRYRGDRSLRKTSRWIEKLLRCYREET